MASDFLKAILPGKIIFFMFGFWQALPGLLIILEKSGKAGKKLGNSIIIILSQPQIRRLTPAVICESAAKFKSFHY